MPFTGGKIAIEYSMEIAEGGYIYSLHGCPSLKSSDDKTGAHIRFQGNSQGRTYVETNAMNTNYALLNTSWQSGINYRIKIICDYSTKSYEYYVDKGNGYERKMLSNGRDIFSFETGGSNLAKIQFNFANNYSSNPSKIYLDDFKVYPLSVNYFVSPLGNDNNDGSFDSPFLTHQKATSEVKRLKGLGNVPNEGVFIFLKGGTYNFDSNYIFGHLDLGDNPNRIAYRPMYGEDIVIQGDYRVDPFTELDEFPDKEIVNEFMRDIKKKYRGWMSQY